MKSQQVLFKWFAISFFLAMLMGFALVLPTVSAQEENTPTPTETSIVLTPVSTGTPPEEIPVPTLTPTPMAEPEESAPPFSVQGAEQSVPSSTDWSAPLNISVTDSDSRKPS
ncbi:MAG: hypothetical protein HZB19_11730, partial [Chloroflexi bacterium]|nr:hypothetical protein [Chloroflexota bacterium]